MEKTAFIFYVVTGTLAAILVAVVGAMLYGLYDQRVDNKEIFAVIGPAFHTIVGAFVGILSARFLPRRPD